MSLEAAYMIGNDIKIINNKITCLSKFLFLKNPKRPNGKKTKNIGKTAKATDLIKEITPRDAVNSDTLSVAYVGGSGSPNFIPAAIEWLIIPSYPIVSILTETMGNKINRKIDMAIKYLRIIFLSLLHLRRKKIDKGIIKNTAS